MNDEALLVEIELNSVPAIRGNENIVTFFPGGGLDNIHQIPEWAYQKLLSDTPVVDKLEKDSDFLKIRIGYRDGQSASTLINRIYDLDRRIFIHEITFTSRAQESSIGYAVIAEVGYAKDNIYSMLNILEGVSAQILKPEQTEFIKVVG